MKQQTAIINCSERSFGASETIACHLTCSIYFTLKFWQISINPKHLTGFFNVNAMNILHTKSFITANNSLLLSYL